MIRTNRFGSCSSNESKMIGIVIASRGHGIRCHNPSNFLVANVLNYLGYRSTGFIFEEWSPLSNELLLLLQNKPITKIRAHPDQSTYRSLAWTQTQPCRGDKILTTYHDRFIIHCRKTLACRLLMKTHPYRPQLSFLFPLSSPLLSSHAHAQEDTHSGKRKIYLHSNITRQHIDMHLPSNIEGD